MKDKKENIDKLDRLLEEVDSKSKEKPTYEKVQEVKKSPKTLIIVLICITIIIITGLSLYIVNRPKKKAVKEETVKLIDLKDLSGLTVEQASSIIGSKKIDIQVDNYVESNDYDENQIVSQLPKAGKVKEGTVVKVIVSKGQAKVKMPKVTGKSLKDATKILKKIGITVNVKKEYDEDIKKGYVIDSSADKGEEINVGGEIDLTVSKGRKKEKENILNSQEAVQTQAANISQEYSRTKNKIKKKNKTKKKSKKKSKPVIINIAD